MTDRRDGAARALRLRGGGCALLLACTACGGDAEPRASARPAAPVQAGEARPLADAAAADSLAIQAYGSPPGFPLPFRTAVPAGFRADAELEGRGAAVRFTWTVRGERRDSAFVYVRVMDEGTTDGRAREIVRTVAERVRIPGDRTELDPRERHPWAVVEYPIRSLGTFGEPVQGWVALGQREGRWFYVITQAPAETWPRFAPQAERILSEWRWAGADGRAASGLGAP